MSDSAAIVADRVTGHHGEMYAVDGFSFAG